MNNNNDNNDVASSIVTNNNMNNNNDNDVASSIVTNNNMNNNNDTTISQSKTTTTAEYIKLRRSLTRPALSLQQRIETLTTTLNEHINTPTVDEIDMDKAINDVKCSIKALEVLMKRCEVVKADARKSPSGLDNIVQLLYIIDHMNVDISSKNYTTDELQSLSYLSQVSDVENSDEINELRSFIENIEAIHDNIRIGQENRDIQLLEATMQDIRRYELEWDILKHLEASIMNINAYESLIEMIHEEKLENALDNTRINEEDTKSACMLKQLIIDMTEQWESVVRVIGFIQALQTAVDDDNHDECRVAIKHIEDYRLNRTDDHHPPNLSFALKLVDSIKVTLSRSASLSSASLSSPLITQQRKQRRKRPMLLSTRRSEVMEAKEAEEKEENDQYDPFGFDDDEEDATTTATTTTIENHNDIEYIKPKVDDDVDYKYHTWKMPMVAMSEINLSNINHDDDDDNDNDDDNGEESKRNRQTITLAELSRKNNEKKHRLGGRFMSTEDKTHIYGQFHDLLYNTTAPVKRKRITIRMNPQIMQKHVLERELSGNRLVTSGTNNICMNTNNTRRTLKLSATRGSAKRGVYVATAKSMTKIMKPSSTRILKSASNSSVGLLQRTQIVPKLTYQHSEPLLKPATKSSNRSEHYRRPSVAYQPAYNGVCVVPHRIKHDVEMKDTKNIDAIHIQMETIATSKSTSDTELSVNSSCNDSNDHHNIDTTSNDDDDNDDDGDDNNNNMLAHATSQVLQVPADIMKLHSQHTTKIDVTSTNDHAGGKKRCSGCIIS